MGYRDEGVGGGIRGEEGAGEIAATEVGGACMTEDLHGGQQSRAEQAGKKGVPR